MAAWYGGPSVADDVLLSIVHEDQDLLVVDKPAGLVCHPTKAGEWSSLVGRVRLHLGADGRLVNRLDRETSGLVLVARSAEVASALGRLFVTREVVKIYHAIVEGTVACDAFTMRDPIGDDEASPVAIKACVRPDGQPAETHARVLRRWDAGGASYTLLEVQPATGRKHQIRVHLAAAGYPIVGDKLYGADPLRYLRFVEGRLTDDDRRALRLEHHALHASSLRWSWRGRDWAFEAPLPARFAQAAGAGR